MRNILIVGGEQESRNEYALQNIMTSVCLSENKPCNICIHCSRVLNNTHPNVFFISPFINEQGTKESIKIEQIRTVLLEQHKQSFENTISFFVISELNNITKQAANALLKVMEETHEQKVFIALASSKMSVLPTLRSRLIIKYLKPSIKKSFNEDVENFIYTVCNTQPSQRSLLINSIPQEKINVINYLLEMQQIVHMFLVDNKKDRWPYFVILKMSESLQKSIESIEKNLNTKLVLEVLILKLWPYYPQTIK